MDVRESLDLLGRARALAERRDYAGVAALLEDVEEAALVDEPELGYHLAYAWRRLGRSVDALRLAGAVDVPIRRRAEDRLVRRHISLEAMLRYDIGEVGRAEQLWEKQAEVAAAADDYVLLAAAYNNLGVVRTLQDRTEEALASYTRALLASRRLGDRRGLAQAHQNLAILFRERRLAREASAHFRQAMEHARVSGSEDVLGRAEEERALLFLDGGDEPLATVSARRGLERLVRIGDGAGEGEALRVLGITALRRGDHPDARTRLTAARERADASASALLMAETLEALAVLESLEGRGEEAERLRAEATAGFRKVGAPAWGRRIRARTAELASAG